MQYKLGRKHPTQAKLKLHRYLGPALPPPPPSVDWGLGMSEDWQMMANDRLGDCTCAAMGHAVQVITSNGDGLITPSDEEILNMYRASGWSPDDPNSDQGWTELAAMQFMCDFGLDRVKMDAFADVETANLEQVKQAIALFGGCYIGVVITQEDMDDFQANRAWQSLDVSSPLGGHALWVPSYDETGITVITWGKAQNATWGWLQSHCDEVHACLFWNWVKNSVDCSPDGFNLQQMTDDLAAM